jgi:hypothetical protein
VLLGGVLHQTKRPEVVENGREIDGNSMNETVILDAHGQKHTN